MKLRVGLVIAVLVGFALSVAGQTSAATGASVSVPPVIQFSSVATDEGGAPLSGTIPMTFCLCNNSQSGDARQEILKD